MDSLQYKAKQRQSSVICIQPDSDMELYDSDVYHVEWENSPDQNRDIQPDEIPEEITDQITESATTPRTEIYKFHTKLAKLAKQLADITTATLRQSKFSEEDMEFSYLIGDCGEGLAGVGEFLTEAAKTISKNVSDEIPEVIEITDSDEDTPVNNEMSITVPSANSTVPSPSVWVSANSTLPSPSVQVSVNNTRHVVSDTMSATHQLVQTSGKKHTVHVCELCGKHQDEA